LRANLIAAHVCMRSALPGMRRRRWGRIVNIGYSRAEQLRAFPGILPYAAAKTGLLLLTRTAAAAEAAAGITVNMVSPGLLKGGLLPRRARITESALGTAADAAAAIRFLVSEEAARTSGTNIIVAGTWKM
jgi:3-oxoacyl-[acyl-carrier protein] reductase